MGNDDRIKADLTLGWEGASFIMQRIHRQGTNVINFPLQAIASTLSHLRILCFSNLLKLKMW